MVSNKHQFALYFSGLSAVAAEQTVELTTEELIHRMRTVLRLDVGDSCIVFDERVHATALITAVAKRTITVKLTSVSVNQVYKPHIRFLLPLLKREHLDEALYSLTEMGVNQIDLVLTEKSRHETIDSRVKERMMRIIVAAAEQSKHYALPTLTGPIPLVQKINELNPTHEQAFFFDPAGQPLKNYITSLSSKPVVLLVGPEGDLTEGEKKLLHEKQVVFCALTPTILRAHQACALAAGLVRSL